METDKTSQSDETKEASARGAHLIAETWGKTNDRPLPSHDYEQEIRFAVVMYGGVSLASRNSLVFQDLRSSDGPTA